VRGGSVVGTGGVGRALSGVGERHGALPALTWDQVREMLRGPVTVGSHTLTHPHLTQIPGEALRRELMRSRDVIAAETGVETELFCYPHGDMNARVRDAVRLAGYRLACSTYPGPVTLASDPLAVPRTFIARADT